IVSKVTRKYIEHNRTRTYCCPDGLTSEEVQYRIANYHQPYIDAVFRTIEHSVACKKFPLLFNIHTYTPALFGYKRKLFAVSGDRDAVLVNLFVKYLRVELADPKVRRELRAAGVSSENDFADEVDVNIPYNLCRTDLETGEPNLRREKNMAAQYSLKY